MENLDGSSDGISCVCSLTVGPRLKDSSEIDSVTVPWIERISLSLKAGAEDV